jgi:hypothetical protein
MGGGIPSLLGYPSDSDSGPTAQLESHCFHNDSNSEPDSEPNDSHLLDFRASTRPNNALGSLAILSLGTKLGDTTGEKG